MGALRDDLIATRALIDTPEKYEAIRDRSGDASGILQALFEATTPADGKDRFAPAWEALARGLPDGRIDSLYEYNRPFPIIMALFDRAIERAKASL